MVQRNRFSALIISLYLRIHRWNFGPPEPSASQSEMRRTWSANMKVNCQQSEYRSGRVRGINVCGAGGRGRSMDSHGFLRNRTDCQPVISLLPTVGVDRVAPSPLRQDGDELGGLRCPGRCLGDKVRCGCATRQSTRVSRGWLAKSLPCGSGSVCVWLLGSDLTDVRRDAMGLSDLLSHGLVVTYRQLDRPRPEIPPMCPTVSAGWALNVTLTVRVLGQCRDRRGGKTR